MGCAGASWCRRSLSITTAVIVTGASTAVSSMLLICVAELYKLLRVFAVTAQAIATGAADISQTILDDACSHSAAYEGLSSLPESAGSSSETEQDAPAAVPAVAPVDNAAEGRAGFESGFSKLFLLVEKHKRVGSSAPFVTDSASVADDVLPQQAAVEPVPATRLAAAWQDSPEALGVGVVWDARLLKLFKPLCISRVSAAHRTRDVRRRLRSRVKAPGNASGSPKARAPGLVCASLGPPQQAQYYDPECTFTPYICPKSLKIAETNRVSTCDVPLGDAFASICMACIHT